ncbi:MAG: ribosomal protein S18-alanine N-acetyltransferase [Phenylobacterium sp.]|uniref:ribosomal protein S18-alanine N-acetyltransferase n=1 Tax=Phenylobacterium sp. TaxID=1871053 RepID=UPI0027272B95|nr:ribosomal protein S18-alanine N-acetyltransferase [Phenylobacterium sp.]MDO8899730.1 ribosomal protein S18-alanine N-acetyltransferase [Phenylobacterium sp.]MDP2213327.1 ribosomal protein S18-alanine N-acetyltransferase [Phenylobacterium sp.]
MRLSPAGPEAAQALAALHAQAFDKPWSAQDIAALIGGAGAYAVMAQDEAPLGMVMSRILFEEAEILTLAVAPEARRRGVGAALVNAAAGLARQGGALSLVLEVGEDNPAAIALYGAAGFAQVGRRRNYYDRGGRQIDALLMRLDLNSERP